MRLVELFEEPAPARPAASGTPAPPGRRRTSLLLTALVGAAALVAGLLAQSARDRTRESYLEKVPGVLRTSGAGLRMLWTVDAAETRSVLAGVVVSGTLVRVRDAGTGMPSAVVGTDPDTGRDLWVSEPPWPSGGARPLIWVECGSSGAVAACLAEAGDGYLAWWLDPATGVPLQVRELPSQVATALVGGQVWVLRGYDTQGRVRLVRDEPDRLRLSALDPASGEEAWAWDGPPGFVGAAWSASIVGDATLIRRGDTGWLVHPGGSVRTVALKAVFGAFTTGRATELVQRLSAGQGLARLLTASGAWRVVPGTPLPLAVDDGSGAGLELLRGSAAVEGATLALDGATGDARWRLAGGADQALVLDGRLIVAQDTVLAAVDVATGATLWSTPLADRPLTLGTDGDAVLVGTQRRVEAFGLADGRQRWRTDVVALLGGAGSAWQGERVRMDTGVPHVVVTRRDGSAAVLG